MGDFPKNRFVFKVIISNEIGYKKKKNRFVFKIIISNEIGYKKKNRFNRFCLGPRLYLLLVPIFHFDGTNNK